MMHLFKPKWTDIFLLPVLLLKPVARWFWQEAPTPPHYVKTTYVVMQHYSNGEPPSEYGRTDDPKEAVRLSMEAMGDKDPFLVKASIDVAPLPGKGRG